MHVVCSSAAHLTRQLALRCCQRRLSLLHLLLLPHDDGLLALGLLLGQPHVTLQRAVAEGRAERFSSPLYLGKLMRQIDLKPAVQQAYYRQIVCHVSITDDKASSMAMLLHAELHKKQWHNSTCVDRSEPEQRGRG